MFDMNAQVLKFIFVPGRYWAGRRESKKEKIYTHWGEGEEEEEEQLLQTELECLGGKRKMQTMAEMILIHQVYLNLGTRNVDLCIQSKVSRGC